MDSRVVTSWDPRSWDPRSWLLGLPSRIKALRAHLLSLWNRPEKRPGLILGFLVGVTLIVTTGIVVIRGPNWLTSAHAGPGSTASHGPIHPGGSREPGVPDSSGEGTRTRGPGTNGRARLHQATVTDGPSPVESFLRRNPFGLAQDEPKVAVPPPQPVPVTNQPPPSFQFQEFIKKLTLLGTYLSSNRKYAIINGPGGEDLYGVGDPIEEARILEIEAQRVSLMFNGTRGYLDIKFDGWKPPDESVQTEPSTPKFQQVAPTASSARRLPRAEVDHYLENLGNVLSNVSLQPFYQNGRQVGFKVDRVQRGSIFAKLGMTNGDVIRFVNGQRIDSVQSAYQIYNILRDSTNVEITILRDTRPVVMRYLIY